MHGNNYLSIPHYQFTGWREKKELSWTGEFLHRNDRFVSPYKRRKPLLPAHCSFPINSHCLRLLPLVQDQWYFCVESFRATQFCSVLLFTYNSTFCMWSFGLSCFTQLSRSKIAAFTKLLCKCQRAVTATMMLNLQRLWRDMWHWKVDSSERTVWILNENRSNAGKTYGHTEMVLFYEWKL